MTRMATPKIAGTLLIVGMLAVLIGVGTFRGNFAFATKGDNGGNNNNGNDNHDDNTINGNKADPPGSDAGCTGNPHDFSQPRGNPHDFSEGEQTGNPHECFEFVLPESLVGSLVLILSSVGVLGAFMVYNSHIVRSFFKGIV